MDCRFDKQPQTSGLVRDEALGRGKATRRKNWLGGEPSLI